MVRFEEVTEAYHEYQRLGEKTLLHSIFYHFYIKNDLDLDLIVQVEQCSIIGQ